MMSRRWRWSLTGVLGTLVAVFLTMIPAWGDSPVVTDTGLLRLQLNSSGDQFIFDPVAGQDQIQTLSETNCRLSSGGANLVSVVGNGNQANKHPYAGLKSNRIGVGQNGEGNGEPCARIDRALGQTLILSLTGELGGQGISYAEIDLGFKFNGDAVLELRRGGALVDTVIVPCSGASDCGPDSGGSDNERVILWFDSNDAPGAGHWQDFQIAGVFDSILLKPGTASSSGAISLEGGGDGSPAGPLGVGLGVADTLFSLVEVFDGEIDCTETETLLEHPDSKLQITRGLDTNGGCKGPEDGLLFTFDAGIEGNELFVDFITEPVDANPGTVAQFLEVITWRFDDPPDVPGGDPQHRTLSYDDHVGAGKQDMPWCLIDPRDGNGNLPVGTVSDPVDTTVILPAGGHTSCLISSHSRVTGLTDILTYPLGTWVKIDVVYNIGDGKRWS